jgi:hypothetical protein
MMFTTAGVTVFATSVNPDVGRAPAATAGRSSAIGDGFEAWENERGV